LWNRDATGGGTDDPPVIREKKTARQGKEKKRGKKMPTRKSVAVGRREKKGALGHGLVNGVLEGKGQV